MSTLQGPRPQINSAKNFHSKRTPPNSLYLLPSSSGNLSRTIPKSQFVCEMQIPPPLRTHSRYPSWECQPSREMLKRHATRKPEPSPLANSCMIWEETIQDKPHDGSFPYQTPRYSRYQLSASSSASLGRQLERKKTLQIYDVDSDDESGILCFGRCQCWITCMFSLKDLLVPPGTNDCVRFLTDLCNPFKTAPSRGTPNNLLVKSRYSSRHLPPALL